MVVPKEADEMLSTESSGRLMPQPSPTPLFMRFGTRRGAIGLSGFRSVQTDKAPDRSSYLSGFAAPRRGHFVSRQSEDKTDHVVFTCELATGR